MKLNTPLWLKRLLFCLVQSNWDCKIPALRENHPIRAAALVTVPFPSFSAPSNPFHIVVYVHCPFPPYPFSVLLFPHTKNNVEITFNLFLFVTLFLWNGVYAMMLAGILIMPIIYTFNYMHSLMVRASGNEMYDYMLLQTAGPRSVNFGKHMHVDKLPWPVKFH